MFKNRWTKATLVALLLAVLVIVPLTVAFAGQPNQSCQAQTSTPGQAASARGSAFNTSGVAGGVYAGQQTQNTSNPKSVSQYDVACAQVSSH